ncbi:hypothetical protein K504DRAFT_458124 [Pleomassaria siparia CBS 279.74]|uniref:DUF3752 domain-containing protein n=1 Tax=Pleomassaria siparia CBS 279.74 TaxID=1314801 RepID=A0A6G1K5B1_9PLEO|nr:hypothetical protein K504DRAFT_458124 [Pleomassaria siparia CBS 279.74]
MSSIGPSLPPHLAKRNRDEDDDRPASPDSSEKRRRVLGPAAPPRVVGPALPPSNSHSRSSSENSDVGPAPPPSSKPVRVLGPAAPPAALSERPPNPPSDDSDSDSSDDEFGPALPPSGTTYSAYDGDILAKSGTSAFDTEEQYVEQAKKVQRDEWMTMPPTQDDLSARMDPTKLRARKFNSGKGARAPAGDGMGVWTETPEQKLKRLQNEALGITAPANSSTTQQDSKKTREEEERLSRLRKKVESSRGSSLMDQHKEKAAGKQQEDDPSKRVFDYEKDMGMSMKIGNKQRSDLLKQAKGFGDRFSSGSFQ